MGVGGFFKTIGKISFPFLSTAAQAGGPFTAMAAASIGKVLGIAPDGLDTPEKIENAMAQASMTPDQLLALKKAEQDFKLQCDQLEISREQIAATDRANARQMQITTKSWIVPTLAVVIVVGFLGLLTLMLLGKMHVSDQQALLLLLGGLNTSFGAVVMYFFGSSQGSDRKTELLAQAPPVSK